MELQGIGEGPVDADIVSASGPEDWIERAAVTAAFVCLVHCLAVPLLFAALPAVGQVLHLPESLHVWLLALALPTSVFALTTGTIKHRRPYPFVVGALGLILIALGAFACTTSSAETTTTVAGSVCLAIAHIGNWRLRHRGHGHLLPKPLVLWKPLVDKCTASSGP